MADKPFVYDEEQKCFRPADASAIETIAAARPASPPPPAPARPATPGPAAHVSHRRHKHSRRFHWKPYFWIGFGVLLVVWVVLLVRAGRDWPSLFDGNKNQEAPKIPYREIPQPRPNP
jgi:hypothetical protein